MLLDWLFGRNKNVKVDKSKVDSEEIIRKVEAAREGQVTVREVEALGPGLNQTVTFGRNGHGEVAEVVLNLPEQNYRKVIINHDGFFEDFPGILKGKWTRYIEGNFDFNAGRVNYRTSFEKQEDGGYRCYWEIQPDGRYWADEDGFGMENDLELVLSADLTDKGEFKGPFRIYKVDGDRVDEQMQEIQE